MRVEGAGMTNGAVFDQFTDYLTVAGYARSTITHRIRVCRLYPGDLLAAKPPELITWLAQFSEPATRHSYRTAVLYFHRWAVTMGLLDRNPTDLVPRVHVPRTLPRPPADGALRLLLRATEDETRAAVILMAYCGLRLSEVLAARPEHLSQTDGEWLLTLPQAKGGRNQVVPVPGWVPSEVLPYLPLGVSGTAMRRRLSIAFAAAGIDDSPHALRHWFGTASLRTCGNLRVVQQMMRHRSIASTQIYTLIVASETSAVSNSLPRFDQGDDSPHDQLALPLVA